MAHGAPLWERPPPLPSPQPLFLPPSGLGPASAPQATGPATIVSAMSTVTTRTDTLRPSVIGMFSPFLRSYPLGGLTHRVQQISHPPACLPSLLWFPWKPWPWVTP